MYNIRFEAINDNVNPIDLYRWISQNWEPASQTPTKTLLYIARCISRGEGWQPEYLELSESVRKALRRNDFSSDIIKLVQFETDDPFERERIERQKHNDLISDLLKRGATGDAEAAIKYCQLEFEGKISHGAFA